MKQEYKAINTHNNEVFTPSQITLLPCAGFVESGQGVNTHYQPHIKLLQHTGALTKSGEKVFAGDRLKSYHFTSRARGKHEYLYHTVTWNPKLMQWYCLNSGSTDVTAHNEGNNSLWCYMRGNPDFTISGNIHQEGLNK